MHTFTVVFLCIQACLVQMVFSQCIGAGSYGAQVVPAAAVAPGLGCGGSLGYGSSAIAGGLGHGAFGNRALSGLEYAASGVAAYGGSGEGNVAVTGELPVAGNTAVVGSIPVLGVVSFGGNMPAAGSVSICGHCTCGCGY